MPDTDSLQGAAALSHLGLIRARGADAASFLQSQLTSDIAQLDAGTAGLAGYCSAKGRLLASFIAWRSAPDEFMLACSADLLAPTLKRLSMFVLRAKCKLDDATAAFSLHGIAGALPGRPQPLAVWGRSQADALQWLRLPDAAGVLRHLRIAPIDSPPPEGPALALDTWRWLEVQSGVPLIEAATVEQFVPQMVNLELVGGVSFSKGCYPGQEVVARSQYRGTLKRRMALFDVDAAAHAGQEVFHDGDAGQPAGMIVNTASAPSGGASALAEVKLTALAAGHLHLGSATGPRLKPGTLPYALQYDDTL